MSHLSPPSDVAEAAVWWAERGVPVFPCTHSKRPLTPSGFHDATTCLETVRGWWTAHPGAMIGSPVPAGTFVLDVDVAKDRGGDATLERLCAFHGALPDTMIVHTPSGGVHYYFEGDIRNSVNRVGPGLDTRGLGGYVILPPSSNGKGHYALGQSGVVKPAPAPAWLLLAACDEKTPGGGTELEPEEVLGEGGRNNYLFRRASLLRRYGFSAESIYQALSSENIERCSPPLGEDELRTIANSAARYDKEEALTAYRAGAPVEVAKGELFSAPDELVISEDEWATAELSPRCIVDQYLYADVAQLIAPGGVGKTTLVLYEAVHLALGRPLWGLDVLSPGKTIILTKEDGRERLVARLRSICQALDLTPEELATVRCSILIEDLTGKPGAKFATFDGMGIISTRLHEQILEAYCSGEIPAQIVVDPMVSFGASEQAVNDNEQAIVEFARSVIRQAPVCVRFIHHTGKANARESRMDAYSGRGGSAMADGSRMTAVLATWKDGVQDMPLLPPGWEPEGSPILVLARAKLQYAPPDLPRILLRRTGFAYEFATEDATTGVNDTSRVLRSILSRQPLTLKNIKADAKIGSGGMPRIGVTTIEAILDVLEREGQIVHDGGYVRPGPRAGE